MAFEQLKICGVINLTGFKWKAPLLTADFGDGYGAGVLAGSAAGLHAWNLQAAVLPDSENYPVKYQIGGAARTDSRFAYYFEFFKRHISLGNKPFWFLDPDSGKAYLASFDQPEIDFERLALKIFASGLTIKQRRARNVAFNADGSFFAPPTDLKAAPLTRTSVLFSWTKAINDSQAGYDLLFDNVVFQLGLVTEYPFGSLVTGSTHTAQIRSRRADGTTSEYSDAITFVVTDVGTTTTTPPSNITPNAPTAPVTDDVNDAFGFTPAAGYALADHEYSVNGGGSYAPVSTNPIGVGNADYAVGQIKVRVKAAPGRNASAPLSNAVAFTVAANTTPAAPTITSNDTTDEISASHALGASEILISINNAAFAQYDGAVINVGNVARAAGFYRFKTKAASGRNESAIASGPAFTTTVPTSGARTQMQDAAGENMFNAADEAMEQEF